MNEDCAGTIIAGINSKNHYFVTEEMTTEHTERIVLGWTRDKTGAVVDRHPVEVANAVTSAKRDNTQNYVVEHVGKVNKGLSGKVYGVGGVSPTICAEEGMKYNTKIAIPANTKSGTIEMEIGGVCDLSYLSSKTRRGRVQDNGTVSPTLTCGVENHLRRIETDYRIRKLTERECFRLMGVSEADIDKIQASGISKSQQYKMAGNSIVVDVLEKIFDKLFIHTEITSKQLTLF